MPHWLSVLRAAVENSGQRVVAEKIGYSKTTISQVLNDKYPTANLNGIAQAVRGALMDQKVECPGIGAQIPANVCLEHQRAKLNTSSPMRIRLYSACRNGCPNSKLRSNS